MKFLQCFLSPLENCVHGNSEVSLSCAAQLTQQHRFSERQKKTRYRTFSWYIQITTKWLNRKCSVSSSSTAQTRVKTSGHHPMQGGGKSILKTKAEEVPQMLPLHRSSLRLVGGAVAPQTLPAPAPQSKPCSQLQQAEAQHAKLFPITIPDGHPPLS